LGVGGNRGRGRGGGKMALLSSPLVLKPHSFISQAQVYESKRPRPAGARPHPRFWPSTEQLPPISFPSVADASSLTQRLRGVPGGGGGGGGRAQDCVPAAIISETRIQIRSALARRRRGAFFWLLIASIFRACGSRRLRTSEKVFGARLRWTLSTTLHPF